MSALLPMFDGDDGSDHGDGDRRDRRRSLITVALVLIFAVAVIGLAVLAIRSPDHGKHHPQAAPTEVVTLGPPSTSAEVTQPATSAASTIASPTPSPSATPSKTPSSSAAASTSTAKTTSARPSSTPAPSTSSSERCLGCSVGGDGGAIAALNALRTTPADGEVTTAAQTCAAGLALGTDHYCPASAVSATETSQNGSDAVRDARQHGGSWFTDPNLKGFQVGWAYGASGHYICVFFEN